MTAANPPSTPIATTKSAALARVLDLVPKGYTRPVAGQIPVRKLPGLLRKFHAKYGIGCSPAQRLTRKGKGLANAALVVYCPGLPSGTEAGSASVPAPGPQPHLVSTGECGNAPTGTPDGPQADSTAESTMAGEPVFAEWLLLATLGDGPVVDEENLADVTTRRLMWLGYELVRHPARGRAAWTWRRPKAAMAELHALLDDQLRRRHMGAVAETLARIARQPGFHGVRAQSWNLIQEAVARGYRGEVPRLWHMQRVSHGVRWRI